MGTSSLVSPLVVLRTDSSLRCLTDGVGSQLHINILQNFMTNTKPDQMWLPSSEFRPKADFRTITDFEDGEAS